MAKKEPDPGTLERLSKKGEEALARIVEELSKNERVTEALGKAMSAKGKVDSASRRALAQVGLAAADEVEDLRRELGRLEQRLRKIEGGGAAKPAARKTAAKKPAAKP